MTGLAPIDAVQLLHPYLFNPYLGRLNPLRKVCDQSIVSVLISLPFPKKIFHRRNGENDKKHNTYESEIFGNFAHEQLQQIC